VIKRFFKHKHNLLSVFPILSLGALISDIWRNSPHQIIQHDLSSFISSSNQFLIDQTIYSSFFNINPPFLFIFYISYGKIFGYSILGLKLLNILLILLHFTLLYKILESKTNRIITFFAFNFAVVFAYTRNIYGMFLPSESLGTFFMLLALYLCTKKDLTWVKIYIIAFLIALATQTKEIYVFTLLFALYACYEQHRSKYSNLINLVIGYAFTNFLIFFFLFSHHELDDYLDVLQLKQDRFQIPNLKISIVTWVGFLQNQLAMIGLLTALILFAALCLVIRKYKGVIFSKNLFSNSHPGNSFFVLMLIAHTSVLLGLFWGNRDFVAGHVTIAMIFSLILFISSVIQIISRYLLHSQRSRLLLTVLVIVSLGINISFGNVYRPEIISTSFSRENNNYTIIKDEKLESGSCIQQAYGWNSGAVYLYTGLKPCSKYFLLNLIMSDRKRLLEFKRSLISHPPKAIIYDTSGPDLDWFSFERDYFSYGVVLKNCYVKIDDSDVFLARFQDDSQKACLSKFVEFSSRE
jgi:hypothetical protein